jgi:hypothetical protein
MNTPASPSGSPSASPRRCPSCGRALPADGPPACTRCLLERALARADSSPFVVSGAAAAPSAPPDPAELARHFPRLEIGALLGRGAMGTVWRARQLELSRDVALKVLAPELSSDPAFQARFEREARALAALDHAHIVKVYDYGSAGPYTYLVMELVDGASLRELLQQGKLGELEILAFARDICAALGYAHERGVVHRDIKPENLLVDAAGRVKIADFGLAKLIGPAARASLRSATGERVGTPLYMAPEQLEKPSSVDHRADLYSLGVVLYELLTGELPIGRFDAPSKCGSPDARYDGVVLRALEKDPARRQRDAAEVRSELEAASSGAAEPARAGSSADTTVGSTERATEHPSAPLVAAPPQRWSAESFGFGLYYALSIVFVGLSLLPVSAALRNVLTVVLLCGVGFLVVHALLAHRGSTRGRALLASISIFLVGSAAAILLTTEAFLRELYVDVRGIQVADIRFVQGCSLLVVLGGLYVSIRSTRRALREFRHRRAWRLYCGLAFVMLYAFLGTLRFADGDSRARSVCFVIGVAFAVVDFWFGRLDAQLQGPLRRGPLGAQGWNVVLEAGGKRGVKWIRALRAATGCTLAQANAARRTSADWIALVGLEEAEARAVAEQLVRAGAAARASEPVTTAHPDPRLAQAGR